MSDLVSMPVIKDLLTECPICTEHFDATKQIPLRMPCCAQSICQPCLETCSGGSTAIRCPMCRHQHNLPGGVKSLPKETAILKTLDYLKILKGIHHQCTYCPDKKTAEAQCDNCGVFLCSVCLEAHKMNEATERHTIVTFDVQPVPVSLFRRHQCRQQPITFYCHTCKKVVCISCTRVDHDRQGHNVVSVEEAHQELAKSTKDVFVKMNLKSKALNKTEASLMKKLENIEMSKRVAINGINKTFDNLVNELNLRRAVLLSNVDVKSAQNLQLTKDALEKTRDLQARVKSFTEYTKLIRSKADRIEELQVMDSSFPPLSAMLEETPQDVSFVKTGVNFVETNTHHILESIKGAGLIRSVTFSPKERPEQVPDSMAYNAIILDPAEIPTGPMLEWDPGTACGYLRVSRRVVTQSATTHPDTGCRIQKGDLVLASRPLMVRNNPNQQCSYQVNIGFSVNESIPDNGLILETALTPTPVDAALSQRTGLSVRVVACTKHKQQLCLRVAYNNKILRHTPLTQNRGGQTFVLRLSFVLDGANNKLSVTNVDDTTEYMAFTDADFDRPMWVMMGVCNPINADVTGELISGHNDTGFFND